MSTTKTPAIMLVLQENLVFSMRIGTAVHAGPDLRSYWSNSFRSDRATPPDFLLPELYAGRLPFAHVISNQESTVAALIILVAYDSQLHAALAGLQTSLIKLNNDIITTIAGNLKNTDQIAQKARILNGILRQSSPE